MTDITKAISYLIESQFPAYYRDSGPELVAFIKAYYEFLESTDEYSVKMSRQMFDLSDVDESLNSFMSHFHNTYLADFPSIITTDKRFAIKHIVDLYSSKGSKNSLELLLKLLYNEEVDVYYPGQDIIKPSDSEWIKPQYLEVTKSFRNRTFLNKQVVGSKSGAKAFVESVITKRVKGKLIDILYLSSVEGQFEFGEKVTDDGFLSGSPTIIGSLTTINIVQGGRDNKIGDIFDVVTDQAKHGKVRITATEDFTGKVDFKIEDSGYGYTSSYAAGTSDFVANTTKVYVSTALLNVNNSANSFIDYEPVLQRIEKLYLYSASVFNANTSLLGSYLIGKNASNTQVANSIIIAVANTDSNGDIINTPSANSLVTVQMIGDTTFDDQQQLTLSAPVVFTTGEYIDEESAYTLKVSSINGTFTVGDNVSQTSTLTSNSITYTKSKAFGQVQSANSTTIVVNKAWGPFVNGVSLIVNNTPAVNCAVDSVSVSNTGARGLVTGISGSNVDIRIVYGTFDVGNKIRGNTTKRTGTISSVSTTGASTVYLNGNTSANASIGAPAGKNNVTKLYANGIIVGQNTTTIGIYGNTNPFYYSNTGTYYIETDRAQVLSPPRYSNNTIIDLNVPILGIKTGAGATFKLGYLENIETVAINTDIVGANNIADTPFKDILLTGENSGMGTLSSVTINSAGSGYSNGGIITFTGGGKANGDPYSSANAYVSTNGSGAITSITITDIGDGYYTVPTLVLPSGSEANLTPVMRYGFGFLKSVSSGNSALISDVLTSENFLIGSIGTLSKINLGSQYNANPFVKVVNPYISGYAHGNFYIDLNNISGSFKIGENINQIVNLSNTAKGKVLEFDAIAKTLKIQRKSFNVSFVSGIGITGTTSNATADVVDVYDVPDSKVLGDNASIIGNVIVANGVATQVEVIDSGFGYIQDGAVSLESANTEYIMSGITNILKQGIGTGYWRTTSSHLNSEKKIHDNKYYQEYSYDIISGLSLNRYEDIVKKILHVAGNELFGSVEKRLVANLSISSSNSSITII